MPIAAVVADANVLLSAVLGGAASRVILQHGVVAHVTGFNEAEVGEYLPRLCRKFDLPEHLVALQWQLLPRVSHAVGDYEAHLGWADERVGLRDPDDVHPLALARALGLALWSNDRDLEGHGLACYPTAVLLALLESDSRS